MGKIGGNINKGFRPKEKNKRKRRMLIALRVGLAEALQMLILDRWVVDTGFHAEKETGSEATRKAPPQ